MAKERKGPGANRPRSELARVLLADSLRGANWPVSEKAANRVETMQHYVYMRRTLRQAARHRDLIQRRALCV